MTEIAPYLHSEVYKKGIEFIDARAKTNQARLSAVLVSKDTSPHAHRAAHTPVFAQFVSVPARSINPTDDQEPR